MALKPTIYKFALSISDFDRDYYDSANLTVAQHPSESLERMAARLLAFCANSHTDLFFTKGLSTPEEPDIWLKSLDSQILLWVDVGEPSADRIKKASRRAGRVKVYSFNQKSEVWWKLEQEKFSDIECEVYRFTWSEVKRLADSFSRTAELTVTISESTLFVNNESESFEISIECLR